MKKVEISKAEASRNGFLMFYYRIGEEIDIARTAQDYLILAEQCAKLAACCGKVAVEIARQGDVPLKPLTAASKRWIKNLK